MTNVERDLREYLAKEHTMDREGRLKHLMSLYTHHEAIDSVPHKINQKDFQLVISMASHRMFKMKMPVHVSHKRIDMTDSRHVAFIEAVIGYFNSGGLLKREVGFDFTTDEYDFEPLAD